MFVDKLPARALSIRAPWWWFILHGGKDIENRDWPTRFRGTVAIHASKWWSLEQVAFDSETAVHCRIQANTPSTRAETTYRQMRDVGGCLVGTVDIVDCVTKSDSPWFFGNYGFVLANPNPLAVPVSCKGALGFFAIDSDLARASLSGGR